MHQHQQRQNMYTNARHSSSTQQHYQEHPGQLLQTMPTNATSNVDIMQVHSNRRGHKASAHSRVSKSFV